MERSGRPKENGRQRNYAFMYGKLPKCQSFGIDPTIDKLHGYDTIKKSPKERDNNVCNYT
jgi:hypothetical protein